MDSTTSESENKDSLNEREVQHFFDAFDDFKSTKHGFTIDYLEQRSKNPSNKETEEIHEDLTNKETQFTSLQFCLALLNEITSNLDPSYKLCYKIKYANFLLRLIKRNYEFSLLYEVYHQLELEIQSKSLSWNDNEIKSSFHQIVTEKLVVKEENTEDLIELNHLNKIKIDDNLDDLNVDETDNDYNEDVIQNEHLINDDIDIQSEDQNVKCNEALENKDNLNLRNESTKLESPKSSLKKPRRIKKGSKTRNKKSMKLKDSNKKEKVSLINEEKYRRRINPPINCLLCDFTAKTQKHMDKHAFETHADNRLCAQCGHLSDTYEDYSSHNETHILTCEVCQKKILGVNGLEDHMKIHRKIVFVPRVSCDVCGRIVRKTYIKSHIENVHGNSVHKCELCDFTANSKDKIHWHRKRHFMKMLKCPVCGIMVKNLKYHFRSKCSEKIERSTCNICEKSFCNKRSLETHIKHIHEKVLEHQCHVCEHKTYSKYNLRLHVSKVHTKEDIQKICPYCKQKTSSLEYHIKIFHFDDQVKNQITNCEAVINDAS